ncbi:hypothetical protein JQ633_32085 [Bradyrhizobium tropiciagri]|uniref:hypothetical protein n=1 Tax=Bradyrhizobium tropiciagri TaxID=312253 RepID=UPI001BA74A00|nr:hypothetical protein [Bradyrhizobium tropiciagri]MBR0875036.1 hypothetical protein [Bradyrhizobium tropiciagri]
MKKIALSALMVGALGLASVATTSPAEAHWRGGWGGWGPGIAGGLVAGAVTTTCRQMDRSARGRDAGRVSASAALPTVSDA